jgi:hypothetical protein
MKKLILTAIAALLMNATASASDWYLSDSGYQSTYNSDEVSIESSISGDVWIYFNANHPSCTGYSETDLATNIVIEVAGQPIKAAIQCRGDNRASVRPATYAGFNYIIDKFKRSNYVFVKFNDKYSATYSAKGFTKAWTLLNNNKQAI